jgi:hypothetical protein
MKKPRGRKSRDTVSLTTIQFFGAWCFDTTRASNQMADVTVVSQIVLYCHKENFQTLKIVPEKSPKLGCQMVVVTATFSWILPVFIWYNTVTVKHCGREGGREDGAKVAVKVAVNIVSKARQGKNIYGTTIYCIYFYY